MGDWRKSQGETEEISNFIFLAVSSVREGRIRMQLQLKETNRLDFCELGRYQDFDTWQEFKEFYCDGAVDTLKESEHFLIR